MGNCASNKFNESSLTTQWNKPYTCYICKSSIQSKKYLRCHKCNSLFHVKCLYKCSETMNECIACDCPSLTLIDLTPSSSAKLKTWSGKKHSRSSAPLPLLDS